MDRQSLQKQFSAFCAINKPKNLEEAINYFAVFGGLGMEIDMSLSLPELIEKHILKEYKYLRNDINGFTTGDDLFHAILTGAATGDRRTNSSFKRSRVAYNDGMDCIEDLIDLGVVKLESSFQRNYVSDKILFTSPFVRFWFAFISPFFQGIKNGEFDEFFTQFKNRQSEFSNLIFEQLSFEFTKQYFQEDKIYNIGRYWDDTCEINLVAKTKSGKIIVGTCKYTNAKIKKSELTKLKENCEHAGIKPDIFMLFTKKGYTSELKSLKSGSLKLFTCRNFKSLIE